MRRERLNPASVAALLHQTEENLASLGNSDAQTSQTPRFIGVAWPHRSSSGETSTHHRTPRSEDGFQKSYASQEVRQRSPSFPEVYLRSTGSQNMHHGSPGSHHQGEHDSTLVLQNFSAAAEPYTLEAQVQDIRGYLEAFDGGLRRRLKDLLGSCSDVEGQALVDDDRWVSLPPPGARRTDTSTMQEKLKCSLQQFQADHSDILTNFSLLDQRVAERFEVFERDMTQQTSAFTELQEKIQLQFLSLDAKIENQMDGQENLQQLEETFTSHEQDVASWLASLQQRIEDAETGTSKIPALEALTTEELGIQAVRLRDLQDRLEEQAADLKGIAFDNSKQLNHVSLEQLSHHESEVQETLRDQLGKIEQQISSDSELRDRMDEIHQQYLGGLSEMLQQQIAIKAHVDETEAKVQQTVQKLEADTLVETKVQKVQRVAQEELLKQTADLAISALGEIEDLRRESVDNMCSVEAGSEKVAENLRCHFKSSIMEVHKELNGQLNLGIHELDHDVKKLVSECATKSESKAEQIVRAALPKFTENARELASEASSAATSESKAHAEQLLAMTSSKMSGQVEKLISSATEHNTEVLETMRQQMDRRIGEVAKRERERSSMFAGKRDMGLTAERFEEMSEAQEAKMQRMHHTLDQRVRDLKVDSHRTFGNVREKLEQLEATDTSLEANVVEIVGALEVLRTQLGNVRGTLRNLENTSGITEQIKADAEFLDFICEVVDRELKKEDGPLGVHAFQMLQLQDMVSADMRQLQEMVGTAQSDIKSLQGQLTQQIRSSASKENNTAKFTERISSLEVGGHKLTNQVTILEEIVQRLNESFSNLNGLENDVEVLQEELAGVKGRLQPESQEDIDYAARFSEFEVHCQRMLDTMNSDLAAKQNKVMQDFMAHVDAQTVGLTQGLAQFQSSVESLNANMASTESKIMEQVMTHVNNLDMELRKRAEELEQTAESLHTTHRNDFPIDLESTIMEKAKTHSEAVRMELKPCLDKLEESVESLKGAQGNEVEFPSALEAIVLDKAIAHMDTVRIELKSSLDNLEKRSESSNATLDSKIEKVQLKLESSKALTTAVEAPLADRLENDSQCLQAIRGIASSVVELAMQGLMDDVKTDLSVAEDRVMQQTRVAVNAHRISELRERITKLEENEQVVAMQRDHTNLQSDINALHKALASTMDRLISCETDVRLPLAARLERESESVQVIRGIVKASEAASITQFHSLLDSMKKDMEATELRLLGEVQAAIGKESGSYSPAGGLSSSLESRLETSVSKLEDSVTDLSAGVGAFQDDFKLFRREVASELMDTRKSLTECQGAISFLPVEQILALVKSQDMDNTLSTKEFKVEIQEMLESIRSEVAKTESGLMDHLPIFETFQSDTKAKLNDLQNSILNVQTKLGQDLEKALTEKLHGLEASTISVVQVQHTEFQERFLELREEWKRDLDMHMAQLVPDPQAESQLSKAHQSNRLNFHGKSPREPESEEHTSGESALHSVPARHPPVLPSV